MDALTPSPNEIAWLELSAAQRAVWFDLQIDAAPLGYMLGGWARIDDHLDLDAARRAVSMVMARHDAMRLRVDTLLPRQRLDASIIPPVTFTNLSEHPDPDAAFHELARCAFNDSLPLGDTPLFRVDFVQAGASSWYALWRCHHLITDATSVALALQRWAECYNALSGEDGIQLAPSSSFVTCLKADGAYQTSAQHEIDLDYWRARLGTLPEPLVLPPPSSAGQNPTPPAQWRLDGPEYVALAAACHTSGVTTQRGLLVLMALLLSRFFRRRTVDLGLALHRRDFATRDVVGMLAGLMPVRCRFAGNPSLAASVQAIARDVDKDFRHQRMPLDTLARALGRRPGMSGQLFDVVVSHLVNESSGGITIGGRDVARAIFRGPERMPLALYALEQPHTRQHRL